MGVAGGLTEQSRIARVFASAHTAQTGWQECLVSFGSFDMESKEDEWSWASATVRRSEALNTSRTGTVNSLAHQEVTSSDGDLMDGDIDTWGIEHWCELGENIKCKGHLLLGLGELLTFDTSHRLFQFYVMERANCGEVNVSWLRLNGR